MFKVVGGCQDLSVEIFDSKRMIVFEDLNTNILSSTRVFGEVDLCELAFTNFPFQLILGDRLTLYFISLSGCIWTKAVT